jgi:hypothetical protein
VPLFTYHIQSIPKMTEYGPMSTPTELEDFIILTASVNQELAELVRTLRRTRELVQATTVTYPYIESKLDRSIN